MNLKRISYSLIFALAIANGLPSPCVTSKTVSGELSDDLAGEVYVARTLAWQHKESDLEANLSNRTLGRLMRTLKGPAFFKVEGFTPAELIEISPDGAVYFVKVKTGKYAGLTGFVGSEQFHMGQHTPRSAVASLLSTKESTEDVYRAAIQSEADSQHIIHAALKKYAKDFHIIASFDGVTDQDTDTFVIAKGQECYITWECSHTDNNGISFAGNFMADLCDQDGSGVQSLANTIGDHTGKTHVYNHGTFHIKVAADENWSIVVHAR